VEIVTSSQIKIKLIELNKKQQDLLPELRNRGFKICGTELSAITTRVQTGPKAEKVLAAVEEILLNWEKEDE